MKELLFQWQHDLGHLQAEITLAIGAILVLVVGLFKVNQTTIKTVTGLALIATFLHLSGGGHDLFDGFIESTGLALSTTKIILISVLVLLVFPIGSEQRSSYYFILLIMLLGSIFMMEVQHLLLVYLTIELVSYGSYLLTNFSFQKSAHEAGIKYLLFGGVSSAVMLFGMSILYGTSGGLLLSDQMVETPYQALGMTMFLAGILFKISSVPFHIWVPNVYQSALADTTAFFSIVPKLAGLVLLHNVLNQVGWGQEIVLSLGIITILVGTFGALRQTNVRRLISYGAIAHSGFLMPLVVLDVDGSLFVWYAAIYALMNLAIFYAVQAIEAKGVFNVEDYEGLGKELPVFGVGFVVILISLIGLPPTAGFTAKWFLFSSLWSDYQTNSNPLILTYLIVAVFATALALIYYLKSPFGMFFKEGSKEVEISFSKLSIILFFSLLIILLFFVPHWLELL